MAGADGQQPVSRGLQTYSYTSVRLPERDLAESVLELAGTVLERLGPSPSTDATRAAIELAITFWNASVLASPIWTRRRVKELRELRKRMQGGVTPAGDASLFDELTERWKQHFTLEPRLVDGWTYEAGGDGGPRLECTMSLPEGVRAMVPPPIEKRISIGGRFLDEVLIRLTATSSLQFPVDRHRGFIADDGTATVHAKMQTALQLFAEGRLSPLGGAPVSLAIGRRDLGPMVLAEVRCGGDDALHDVAVLVFKRRA